MRKMLVIVSMGLLLPLVSGASLVELPNELGNSPFNEKVLEVPKDKKCSCGETLEVNLTEMKQWTFDWEAQCIHKKPFGLDSVYRKDTIDYYKCSNCAQRYAEIHTTRATKCKGHY